MCMKKWCPLRTMVPPLGTYMNSYVSTTASLRISDSSSTGAFCTSVCVLAGQVRYRMVYTQYPHICILFGIYHFVRRVPADLQQHYRSDRVSISLRTKSARAASRSAVSISQRLDDYWHGLRLQKMDVPALHLVIDDEADMPDNSPTMMEAVDTYLRLKADKQTPTFIRAAKRNGRYVAEALGNRPITSYSSSDAASFRDHLFDKGLSLGSVKRIFGSVRSIINLVMREHGIEGNNAFAKTYMPDRNCRPRQTTCSPRQTGNPAKGLSGN